MPVLLNNPLFVEVGISAVVNGQVCTAYGIVSFNGAIAGIVVGKKE